MKASEFKRQLVVVLLLCFMSWSGTTESAIAAPAGTQGPAQISAVRWGVNRDAVTGSLKIRLVLDMSAPVEVESFVTGVPNWRLMVTVKETAPWKGVIPPSPDKSVVDKLSIGPSGKDATQIVLDLPLSIDENQYKVFTLAADPKLGKPFRIVIDVEKAIPMPDFNFSSGLKNKVIAIDPGHGGTDPGAIGRTYGLKEKTVNLAIAIKVKALLEQAGAQVVMTRLTDVDVSNADASDRDELRARCLVGNNRRADIFISIHNNSSQNSDMNGTTTYYFRKTIYDSILAQTLQSGMVQTSGLENQGIKTANFFVLKNTVMPAALVEIAFLSNQQEELLLTTAQFQQKVAQGIVMGIDQFFAQAAKMRGDKR